MAGRPRPGTWSTIPTPSVPRPEDPSHGNRGAAPRRTRVLLRASLPPVREPRALVAGFQRPRAGPGGGQRPAAPRAGAVPGHLQQQPRRVLPDPRGGPEGAAVRRARHDLTRRDDRARTARRDQRTRPAAHEAAAPDLGEERPAAPGGRRHQRRRLGGSGRRRPRPSAPDVREARVPDPDAVVGGSGTSVPVHLRPVAEPRRRRARPVDAGPPVRAREGAAEHPAAAAVARRRTFHPAGTGDRRQPRHAVPGDGDRGGAPVPGHARPGPRPGDRRGRRPPGRDRVDPPAARAFPRGRPARGARLHAEGGPEADRGRAPRGPVRRLRDPVDARHDRSGRADEARPSGPQVRAVDRHHAAPAATGGERQARHLQRDRRGRRAGPSPVRRVLHVGGAVRVAGRARPGGAGDQADACTGRRARTAASCARWCAPPSPASRPWRSSS